jgi:hypothetical protein
VAIGIYNVANDDSSTDYGKSGKGLTTLSAALFANNFDDYYVGENPNYKSEAYAQIRIGRLSDPYTDYFGPIHIVTDNGLASNMTAVLIHEYAHSLGMISAEGTQGGNLVFFPYDDPQTSLNNYNKYLHDSYGSTAAFRKEIVIADSPDATKFVILPGGYAFFYSTHTKEVLDGAIFPFNNPNKVPGVPILGFENGAPDFSHSELTNSLMSHQNWRNWNTLMEAELAIFQDIGIDIDRKNFFGYSLYKSNVNIAISSNFYERNDDRTYDVGKYNETPLTIGIHIFGSTNTLTINSVVLSKGDSSVGIRVDGQENELTIKGNIHADGNYGIGVLVAYGRDHFITVIGTVSAMGTNSDALRFDFGDNVLGNLFEYRGSYKRRTAINGGYINIDYWTEMTLLQELNGPRVEKVDISGVVVSSRNSIYIAKNAYVKEINIIDGATIKGDIVSMWQPTKNSNFRDLDNVYNYVNYNGAAEDLKTSLTFGSVEKSSFVFHNNIKAMGFLDVSIKNTYFDFVGYMTGISSFSLISSTLAATITNSPVFVSASDVWITDSKVDLDLVDINANNSFRYHSGDDPYFSFEGQTHNQDFEVAITPPLEKKQKYSIGFYDYDELLEPVWDNKSMKLLLFGSHDGTLNESRAALSTINLPLIAVTQNPISNYAFNKRNPQIKKLSPAPSDRKKGQPQGQIEDKWGYLWVSPVYVTSKGDDDGQKWTMDSFYGATGIDLVASNSLYFGVAAQFARPIFKAQDVSAYAEGFDILFYGKASAAHFEMTAMFSGGIDNYHQERTYERATYNTDFSALDEMVGVQIAAPFDISKTVQIKPFASYKLIIIQTAEHNEGAGRYALRYNYSGIMTEDVNAGTEIGVKLFKGVDFNSRIFYRGLYGLKPSEVEVSFVNAPDVKELVTGNPLDRDYFVFSANLDFALSPLLKVGGGWTQSQSTHQKTQTINLNFSLNF